MKTQMSCGNKQNLILVYSPDDKVKYREKVDVLKVQNPHDKFIKEVLGNVEVAQSFLSNYLPKNISRMVNLDSLELQKDSFINEKLAEGYSDLLFKADINGIEGYFYFLIEHKSYHSKGLAIQLLDYMVSIWQVKLRKEKKLELPFIFPLVIYHHESNGSNKQTLGGMIRGYNEINDDLKRFVPDFQYLLFDIARYKDDQLRGSAQLRILFLLLRDIPVKEDEALWDTFTRAMNYLSEIANEETERNLFQTMILYLYSASRNFTNKDYNEIKGLIEQTHPKRSEDMKSFADILREEGMDKVSKKTTEK